MVAASPEAATIFCKSRAVTNSSSRSVSVIYPDFNPCSVIDVRLRWQGRERESLSRWFAGRRRWR